MFLFFDPYLILEVSGIEWRFMAKNNMGNVGLIPTTLDKDIYEWTLQKTCGHQQKCQAWVHNLLFSKAPTPRMQNKLQKVVFSVIRLKFYHKPSRSLI